MKKETVSIIWVVLIAVIVSFFLPYTVVADSSQTWLQKHIYLALAIGQGMLFIFAGFLTMYSAFKVKELGGIIGNALKIFSVGLVCLGLGFIQVPIMGGFNLWETFYYKSNLYFSFYLLGAVLMLGGIFVAAFRFTGKTIATFISVVLFALLFRIGLSLVPRSLVNLQGRTEIAYQVTLTIGAVLTGVALAIVVFSFLLRQSFGTSKVGNVFNTLTSGFIFVLIGTFMTVHLTMVDYTHQWYYLYGVYYGVFFIASFLFCVFGLRLKHFQQ